MGNTHKEDLSPITYMDIHFCGNDSRSLIDSPQDVKYENGIAHLKHPIFQWEYHLYHNLTKDKAKEIKTAIEQNWNSKDPTKYNNVIVCLIDSANDTRLEDLMRDLSKLDNTNMLPAIVFMVSNIIPNEDPKSTIVKKKIPYSELGMIYQIKNDSNQFKNKLLELCAYYNQLGDEFSFNDKTHTVVKTTFTSNVNVMIIGASGAGKSTLINKLLGERRCLARKGMSITTKIIPYHHKDYLLIVFDTPGVENKQDQQKLIELIKNYHIKTKQNNYDNIHLILYVINPKDRFLKQEDIPFLSELQKYKVPIVFLFNYCLNLVFSNDQKKNLEKIFKDNKIANNNICQMNFVNPPWDTKIY